MWVAFRICSDGSNGYPPRLPQLFNDQAVMERWAKGDVGGWQPLYVSDTLVVVWARLWSRGAREAEFFVLIKEVE